MVKITNGRRVESEKSLCVLLVIAFLCGFAIASVGIYALYHVVELRCGQNTCVAEVD